MPDELDRAQDHIEREEEMRRKYHEAHTHSVASTGKCLFCGKNLAEGVRWCDEDCRDDWEYYIQRKLR